MSDGVLQVSLISPMLFNLNDLIKELNQNSYEYKLMLMIYVYYVKE